MHWGHWQTCTYVQAQGGSERQCLLTGPAYYWKVARCSYTLTICISWQSQRNIFRFGNHPEIEMSKQKDEKEDIIQSEFSPFKICMCWVCENIWRQMCNSKWSAMLTKFYGMVAVEFDQRSTAIFEEVNVIFVSKLLSVVWQTLWNISFISRKCLRRFCIIHFFQSWHSVASPFSSSVVISFWLACPLPNHFEEYS